MKKKSKLEKKQDIIKLLCNMNITLEIAKIIEQKKNEKVSKLRTRKNNFC